MHQNTIHFSVAYKGEVIHCEGSTMGWQTRDEESMNVLRRHGRRAEMRCRRAWERDLAQDLRSRF